MRKATRSKVQNIARNEAQFLATLLDQRINRTQDTLYRLMDYLDVSEREIPGVPARKVIKKRGKK